MAIGCDFARALAVARAIVFQSIPVCSRRDTCNSLHVTNLAWFNVTPSIYLIENSFYKKFILQNLELYGMHGAVDKNVKNFSHL